MQILRHAVFGESPEAPGDPARNHLLVLAQDAGEFAVGVWSGSSAGRLRQVYWRPCAGEAEATALFDVESQPIWGNGPIYPTPPAAEVIVDRLAASGETGTRGRPVPRLAMPARASRARLATWRGLARVAALPSTALAFLPDEADRIFCAIDAGGHARLLQPDAANRLLEAVAPGDDRLADLLLPDRPWWDSEPALPSTTFDGFVTGVGKNDPLYWVLDLVRYRTADLTALPLAERLVLRDQALAELAESDRLPARWRPVVHFTRPIDRANLANRVIAAEAAPLPLLAARDLRAVYGARGSLRTAALAEALA